MAGYSRFYVLGGEGGYMGADGVNPIGLLILVGKSDRQWLEPHYFDASAKPLGQLRVIVPAKPDDPDALLDACIAFLPGEFRSCPSLGEVEKALGKTERLDWDADSARVPKAWKRLREESRPIFRNLNIWQADLVPMQGRDEGPQRK